MKRTVKTLVMITLVIAIIFPLATPVQAAGSWKNSWVFCVHRDTTLYVGQLRESAGSASGGKAGVYGTTLSFKSSNSKVVTVDENDMLVAKKVGTATITATDGMYKDSYKVTVKDPKKTKKVVLNYADGADLEYGKTYTLKSLNGSSVKKIVCTSYEEDVTIKGNKITLHPKHSKVVYFLVTLKDGRSTEVTYCCDGKEYLEAVSIIEKAAAEAGISKSSTDLEKAMFAYNWLGENCSYSRKYGKPGYYYAIREGKGDCDVYAEGVELIGEVIGLTVIRIETDTHAFNGVRVDGEWYVMDTTQCEAWDFAVGGGCFLLSYEEATEGGGRKFVISSKSEIKPEFTSTKYDDSKVFSQWKDNYEDPLDDDYWNSFL